MPLSHLLHALKTIYITTDQVDKQKVLWACNCYGALRLPCAASGNKKHHAGAVPKAIQNYSARGIVLVPVALIDHLPDVVFAASQNPTTKQSFALH